MHTRLALDLDLICRRQEQQLHQQPLVLEALNYALTAQLLGNVNTNAL